MRGAGMSDVILNEWIFEVHGPRHGSGPVHIRTENIAARDEAFVGLLVRLAELWLNRGRKGHE